MRAGPRAPPHTQGRDQAPSETRALLLFGFQLPETRVHACFGQLETEEKQSASFRGRLISTLGVRRRARACPHCRARQSTSCALDGILTSSVSRMQIAANG